MFRLQRMKKYVWIFRFSSTDKKVWKKCQVNCLRVNCNKYKSKERRRKNTRSFFFCRKEGEGKTILKVSFKMDRLVWLCNIYLEFWPFFVRNKLESFLKRSLSIRKINFKNSNLHLKVRVIEAVAMFFLKSRFSLRNDEVFGVQTLPNLN